MKRYSFLFFCFLFSYLFPQTHADLIQTRAQEALALKIQKKAPPFLIFSDVDLSGMFATFRSVLYVLDYYERGHYAGLKIDLTKGLYLDPAKGTNWWEYFFEPIHLGCQAGSTYTFSMHDYHYLLPFPLSNQRAFTLIQKYIKIKPFILEEIEAFSAEHFHQAYVIGVHHRGTDKILESCRVPYEKTAQLLNRLISSLTLSQKQALKVYVATDEQNFLHYILEHFFTIPIVYNDFFRSSDNSTSVHGGQFPDKFQVGKEAIIDCLLLSKCHFLLRPGSSTLSQAVSYFNPQLSYINALDVP